MKKLNVKFFCVRERVFFQGSYKINQQFNKFLFNSIQADRFIDRKLDQAESALKKKQKTAKKWYSNLVGDTNGNGPKLNELHIFTISFVAGLALGVGTAA